MCEMIGAAMVTKRKPDLRRAGAHDDATESTRTVLMALGANAGVAVETLPDVAAVRFVRLLYVGPKLLFLVASVDLAGDAPESHVAKKLRRLERELESDPHIVDAVLTIADPDEADRI